MTIFEFDNYRKFIETYIKSLPQHGRGEVSRIANHLKIQTSLVSQILNHKKDFTIEQAHSLCQYLGLQEIETDYFLLLIQHERAGTHDLKRYYKDKIKELRKKSLQLSERLKRDQDLSEVEKATLYSGWHYTAINLLTSIPGYHDPDSLARSLNLPREKVIEALKFLVETNLCKSEGGKFYLGPQITHLEKKSPFIARHHHNWRLQSMQRAEVLTDDELMFTSPLTLSEKDFHHIREEIVELIKRVSSVVRASPEEKLACLNIDWFYVGLK
jgi:uncharacterized protein (TIGR02147 family)